MRSSQLLLITCLWLAPLVVQAEDRFRDVELTIRVRRALQKDPKLKETDISVQVEKGEVTLDGAVLKKETATRAEKLADEVTGTLKVNNRIRTGAFPDFEEWLPPTVFAEEKKVASEPAPVPKPVSTNVPKLKPKIKAVEKPKPKPQPTPREVTKSAPKKSSWNKPIGVKQPEKQMASQPSAAKQTSAKHDPEPILTARRSPIPRESDEEAMRQQLRVILQSYWRYQGLRLFASEGIVSIRGRAMTGQDLNDLATEIARVPGVKRVRIENVEIGQ